MDIDFICASAAWLSLAAGLGLLAALAWIDLRTRLLPDRLVLPLAVAGIVFHSGAREFFLDVPGMALGGIAGFGSLYLLRFAANALTGEDALGLGDVKLMGAAGLWLGPDLVMMAMAAGACVSLVHGLGIAIARAASGGGRIDLARLSLPAGPGFAAGVAGALAWMLKDIQASPLWSPWS